MSEPVTSTAAGTYMIGGITIAGLVAEPLKAKGPSGPHVMVGAW